MNRLHSYFVLWGKKRDKLLKRLVFSAKARCDCGAGLAYDKRAPGLGLQRDLLGDALLVAGERRVRALGACDYYDVTSEKSRTADGATTRP